MTIGIYLLSFKDKNEVYVGQSIDIERRFKQHIWELKDNKHTNYRLQDYYNLYGIPDLSILEICSIDDLYVKEQSWTEEFDSVNSGLNIIEAGICGNGVNSNNSKYTKMQILKVFIMLYKYNATRKQISNRVNVPESVAKNLANGSSHLWLKEQYPTQYDIMRNNGKNIKGALGRSLNKLGVPFIRNMLIDRNNNLHTIEPSLSKWVYANPDFTNKKSALSVLSTLYNGKVNRVKSYKGYRLYNA